VPSTESRAVFEAFLRAANGHDPAALDSLLHADYIGTYPQSGEQIRGAANMGAILANYPGDYENVGHHHVIGSEDRWVVTPSLTLVRVEGGGDTFTGVQKARYPDGTHWHVVTIGEIRDGKIWRTQTIFGQAFEPPAWRSAWVEVTPDPDR